ncbi:MAG: cytochrome b N-terminal domain-containing protein [Deltaproteobacteria bacterium]|nr:cytochrome b N-terminal domain-containing protein [Deltaproteobacteria bacterium]
MSRFLLSRFPVGPLIDFMAKKKVPEHRCSGWYTLGGIALVFLAIQIFTGILLMVYYRPSQPWASVQRIVVEVPFGAFIRSIHHWSANLMALGLFVHMFSTFFMKAYRPTREFTWLTGLCLLGLVLLFSFSGYLLPWDELSFFATRVGITELEKAPLVGTWTATLLRGGPDVTIDTIGRFYVLHVVVLPLTVLGLVVVHLTLVQLHGMSEPDSFAALPPERKRYRPFFTDFLLAEIPIWMLVTGVVLALAAAVPRGLAPEADPTAAAPAGIKPEWYFLAPYQTLKLFPGRLELLGMGLMAAAVLSAAVVPFIDRVVPTDRRGRMVALIGAAGIAGLAAMTAWGGLS